MDFKPGAQTADSHIRNCTNHFNCLIRPKEKFVSEDQNLEMEFEDVAGEDEFEEISGEEVDRVVESLEDLIESVESENIKAFLDDALHNIYYLVHDEDEEEEEYDEEFDGEMELEGEIEDELDETLPDAA